MPLHVDRRLAVPITHALYRTVLNRRLPFAVQRRALDVTARVVQPIPAGTVTEKLTLAGRPAERVTSTKSIDSVVLLYLHGGGYTTGSLTTHRSIAGHLARDAGATVYLLDYRLAPEAPFPAAVDDAVDAYLELLRTRGLRSKQVAIGGDSAGGGLAVATARRLIDQHGVTPAALALIAPWVDPNYVSKRKRDLVINTAWSKACAAAYLGTADPHDPGYAPARGNLEGLPPTLVQIGTRELLYDQVVDFVDNLRSAGVDATRTDYPNLWHVAQLQASLLREAADAVVELGTFLHGALDPALVEPPAGDVG
ncbi:alpha/beta hydrolase [Antrihabitans cavernicola]|uniref:Alpha/beta hydrolase n=1 Tax=Antrihabitans cavernicola TaxID=2495913 RepID=A0A5A7S8Q5_9NOCA|nr:alpha/beta hydrolase [Spelaeibacter cavernicola]KAA0022538.1 alpha/beta hydrolase [Spelaeibacter cavernicola]